MSLNDVLQGIVDDVDGALGAGVVDLNSGMLLGAKHSVPYFTQSFLDAVGATAVELFRGKNITAVYKMLGAQRGDDGVGTINEIQMTSDNTFHFMTVLPGKPDALLVLITGKKTNLGMGWSAVRNAMPTVAALCP